MEFGHKNELLRIEHLGYTYTSKQEALHDINVTFYQGERIAVLGANGAGKSTFFLNINGVRIPDTGKIFMEGMEITRKNRNKLRKMVGIVFQDAEDQIIASTVKSEIAFGPINLNYSKKKVDDLIQKAMKMLNLTTYADRPPHYLSGGEKKRVSIADILAMDTRMIAFDEPTASLDSENIQIFETVLNKLEQEEKTVLISTHDVDFAFRFAQRILIFSNGSLIADGTPEQIFLDEELLHKASLKKPLVLQCYEMLKKKNFLMEQNRNNFPKTIQELEHRIHDI